MDFPKGTHGVPKPSVTLFWSAFIQLLQTRVGRTKTTHYQLNTVYWKDAIMQSYMKTVDVFFPRALQWSRKHVQAFQESTGFHIFSPRPFFDAVKRRELKMAWLKSNIISMDGAEMCREMNNGIKTSSLQRTKIDSTAIKRLGWAFDPQNSK